VIAVDFLFSRLVEFDQAPTAVERRVRGNPPSPRPRLCIRGASFHKPLGVVERVVLHVNHPALASERGRTGQTRDARGASISAHGRERARRPRTPNARGDRRRRGARGAPPIGGGRKAADSEIASIAHMPPQLTRPRTSRHLISEQASRQSDRRTSGRRTEPASNRMLFATATERVARLL
jgi:hypothetical protein